MTSTTLDTVLNLKQIEDQVALLLYAYGVVPASATVERIDFGTPNDQDVVPLKVTIKKEVLTEIAT